MRKIIIASGIALVLFIIIFVLAILNLNFFINGNKDYFISRIEESVGRKISVEEINTGFREGLGIRLRNFSMSDDKSFSDGEFIRAGDVQVNVEFIPLISKKINVSKLILSNPEITIIENKTGEYNFSTLGPERKPSERNSQDNKKKTRELPLYASSIIIKDGQINYIDERNGSEFQIQKINLRIRDLGYNNKIPLELEAAVLSSEPNFKVEGVFGPFNSDLDFHKMQADGTVEISDLNINTLKKFIPAIKKAVPEGLDISGPLETKLKFSGSPDALMLPDFDIKASVFGASVPNLELSGNMGPIGKNVEDFRLDTEFKLKKANLSKLRKFAVIEHSFPNSLSTQGTVDFSGKITGTPEDLEFKSVKLDATGSRLAIIGKFLKPKNTPFVISSGGRISDNLIELKNLDILLNTLNLNASGKINRGTTNLMNLTMSSNKIDLADTGEIFPSISKYNPEGQIQLLKTSLKGELGKGQVPEITGSLIVTDASATPASFPRPVRNINTKVVFEGKSAEIGDMSLNLGKSSINISAKIDQFSPLELSYRIASPELYVSDISKDRQDTKKTEVIKQLESRGKISTRHNVLAVNGELSSSEAALSGFELQQINTGFNFIGETLKIENFAAKAYDGEIKGSASYNMNGESNFSAISGINGLDLNKFVKSRNSETAEKIRGKANLDINIFGSGSGWDEIKKTLKGTANADIADGAVSDINIADDVLQEITGVPGLTFFVAPSTKKKYPQVFTAQDTKFDEFKSSFNIEKGEMVTNNLRILSKDFLITGKGWINLDGKLDLKSQLILSKEFSDDLKTDVPDIRYILNNSGRIEIPFSITGTLPDAKTKPDIPYLAKLIQQTGIREVIKELSTKPDENQEAEEETKSDTAPVKKEKRIDEKIIEGIKDLF